MNIFFSNSLKFWNSIRPEWPSWLNLRDHNFTWIRWSCEARMVIYVGLITSYSQTVICSSSSWVIETDINTRAISIDLHINQQSAKKSRLKVKPPTAIRLKMACKWCISRQLLQFRSWQAHQLASVRPWPVLIHFDSKIISLGLYLRLKQVCFINKLFFVLEHYLVLLTDAVFGL